MLCLLMGMERLQQNTGIQPALIDGWKHERGTRRLRVRNNALHKRTPLVYQSTIKGPADVTVAQEAQELRAC